MKPGLRQRLTVHRQRKAAVHRREEAKVKDGKGKHRVKISQARAAMGSEGREAR